MMAQARAALSYAGPVIARHCARKRLAVRPRSRQAVVRIWIVSTSIHRRPFFGKRVLLAKLVLVAVQIVNILRNDNALRVLPGTLADAIASVHGRLISQCACAQVCPPRFVARSCRCSQLLTDRVSTGQTAEVRAIARSSARNEEAHVRIVLGNGQVWNGQYQDQY